MADQQIYLQLLAIAIGIISVENRRRTESCELRINDINDYAFKDSRLGRGCDFEGGAE